MRTLKFLSLSFKVVYLFKEIIVELLFFISLIFFKSRLFLLIFILWFFLIICLKFFGELRWFKWKLRCFKSSLVFVFCLIRMIWSIIYVWSLLMNILRAILHKLVFLLGLAFKIIVFISILFVIIVKLKHVVCLICLIIFITHIHNIKDDSFPKITLIGFIRY